MQSQRKYKRIFLFLTLFLSACAGAAPTENPEAAMTSAVGTMVAAFFETQTAMVTPATPTPTPTETKFPTPTSFATLPPLSTLTPTLFFSTSALGSPTVTGTLPTVTVNASALAFGCNNLAFVRDVNFPNGTVVQPGQGFKKTWKVANNGTCDWMYVFRLVFVSGQEMFPYIDKINKKVAPGSWNELSVGLTAPKKPGTYSAYFRFTDGGGHAFGATLGVTIKVEGAPTNTIAPTNTPTPTPTNTAVYPPP